MVEGHHGAAASIAATAAGAPLEQRGAARLAGLLIRHRASCLILLTLLTLAAAWRAAQLDFDFAFRNFFLDQHEDEFGRALIDAFGSAGGSYLVAVLEGADALQPDALAAVRSMSDAVAAVPHIEQVFSLATVPAIAADRARVLVRPLPDLPRDGAERDAVRHAVLGSPLLVRRLLSPDARVTAVVALLDDAHRDLRRRAATITAFRAAVAATLPAGFRARFTGYPIAEAAYAELVWRGFLIANVAAAVLMAAALFLCFHSWAGVCLPLAVVGIATLLTLGCMQLLGMPVTLTNAAVPLLLLVIGVAEIAFFVARYHEEAARGGARDAVIARTAAGVVPPAFISAATTSAGFLSLGLGHIALTRQLGVIMAIGVLATFVVAVLLLPGVLAMLPPPPAAALRPLNSGPVARLLDRIAGINLAHRGWVFGASLVGLALSLLAARQMHVDQYATRELSAQHPLRQAQRVVDGALMGGFQTQIGVRWRDRRRLASNADLLPIARLQSFLGTQPGVIKTWSVVDYVAEIRMAIFDGDPAERRLGGADERPIDSLQLLGRDDADLATLIDPTRTLAAIMVGTSDLGTGALLALWERTRAFATAQFGDAVEVHIAGDYWRIANGTTSLVEDLLASTASSFLLVFAVVALALRSWRLTLLSIPPNLLPIAFALGLMGVADFPLRIGTSIILPVCLGIAVDSTVHYLSRVREEWRRDADLAAATRRALHGTGRGMLFSAVVLVVGFLCFLIPEFLVYRHVGLLAAATLCAALLADVFLTPSLVLAWPPFAPRRRESA